MSEQTQRQEFDFSMLSDSIKVFQPTVRTETVTVLPEFNLDNQLEDLQIRVDVLSNLCSRIETEIPKINNIVHVSACILDIVKEIRRFKGISPNSDKRGKIIEYLRLLLKVLGLIKKIASLVNMIAPNPIATEVLVAAGIAHAILTVIISSYDIINDEGDVLDAIIDIIASIAELVPLTGASHAGDIKRTVQSGCRAVSSMRRVLKPMENNLNMIDIIHKLGDIERCFDACENFANSFQHL